MQHRACQIERDGVVYQVEGSPLLPLRFHGAIHEKRLARSGAEVRAVVPSVAAWVVALWFVLAGAAAGRIAWGLIHAGNAGWAPIVVIIIAGLLAVIFRLAGLDMLTDRIRFDRAAGQAKRWRLFRMVWSVNLEDVLAVQCLYIGRTETKSGSIPQYQVNLVLRAASDQRVLVCGDWDPAWVLRLGQDLADFLKVPLVNQT
jgi:hypothetical protein